jgi:4-hydroxybenzoate polyprenyltransferase
VAAVLRIILDVARFRLARLEMANVVAAIAITFALALPWAEIAVRATFGVLLNFLVYLNNDWYDIGDDLEAVRKDHDKTRFLAEHPREAVVAQALLLAALAVLALWWGGGLWLALLLGGGVCFAYSAGLKRIPIVDVVAMTLWGAAMPLVGVPGGDPRGYLLLGQLALASGTFESIQVVRDHDDDAARGVRTTAVVLGVHRTRWLIRALLTACAVYAGVGFHPLLALLPAAALLLPIEVVSVEQYWNRIRLLLGLTFLAECLLVRFG